MVKKVTIKDIAKELKVTPMTVSNALSGKGRVGDELKQKIVNTAGKLGYQPNTFARALVSGKTNRIAVVMPGFTSQFGMGVLEAVEKAANYLDYEVSVSSSSRNADALKDLAGSSKADGVIAIAMNAAPGIAFLYEQAKIPLVLVEGQGNAEGMQVGINNEKAAYDAVSYLISKKKKMIAIVTGSIDMAGSQKKRIKGYKAALAEAKLEAEVELDVVVPGYTHRDGIKAWETLSSRKFDALFCAAGDMVAVGFINEAREKGVRIPEDIAVIGFDDLPMAQTLNLTTVRQPLDEMGEAAFGKISSVLGGSAQPVQKTEFDAELIIRATA